MKQFIIAILVITLIGISNCRAEDIDVDKMVEAIFIAEGGYEATYLYGIKSVSYKDEEEARRICYNSVRNNIKRWEAAGYPGDFITFMSKRYAPIGAKNDKQNLNRFWIKNVKGFYEKR